MAANEEESLERAEYFAASLDFEQSAAYYQQVFIYLFL
jgi:hypothetical protein